MKKILKAVLLGLTSALIFVACSETKTDKKESQKGEMMTVQTSKGEVNLPKNPKKVAIFDYGALDTINALGIDAKIATPVSSIPKSLEKT